MRTRFDAAYYKKFYENPKTRAVDQAGAKRQAAFIAAYVRYLEMDVKRILDLGCGMGRVLRALGREFPKATCVGVEYSEYLCEKYGFIQGSAVDFSADPFDLVVCNDVLSYLPPDDCSKALANIAALTEQVCFLGVLTAEDREMCDFQRTDRLQHMRPAAWYRRRLSQNFLNLGGGIHLRKPVAVPIWTLDGGPSWPPTDS